MEVIIASAFSALIIFITVFSIIKVLIIGVQRKEISPRKLFIFSAASIFSGLIIASILPLGYAKILEHIY